MNTLLIFFALPIATIIISIALQKVLRSPLLVAAVLFAVFLIITFVINNLNFLVATIVYTIISFITAFIVYAVCRFLRQYNSENNGDDESNINCPCRYANNISDNENLLTIRDNSNTNTLVTANTNYNEIQRTNQNNTTNNEVTARISVVPNNNTNGRTGCVCGNYRRR